ncbi:MAG: peptidylprolyl isomerase [Nitrospinota bacterium]
MKLYNKSWLLLVSSFLLLSCFEGNSSQSSLADDEIIVTINEEKITSKQFKKVLFGQKKIFRVQNTQELKPEELTWIKSRVLDEIVKNTLLAQEISKNNISIDQKQLDEAIARAREGYIEGALEKTLELEGISREEWEASIKNKLLTNKLIHHLVNSKVSISDKELKDYFNKSDNKFHKKEQVRALHIMVETEEEIREIQKELQGKQKSFSELAREFSLGPEGAQGGDLGYFEAGQMPEEFDDVFKLKTNKVSDIIRTPYGFHLFKVVDKIKERKMSFEESKGRIERILLQELQDKAFQEWFLTLKQKARIDIDYDSLQKIS